MIIGFEFSLGQDRSTLGYAYSLSDDGNCQRGGFVHIEHQHDPDAVRRNTLLNNRDLLRQPFVSAVEKYVQTKNTYPQRIVVYRSGISPGKNEGVYTEECQTMGAILEEIYQGKAELPHIIIIGCFRGHNSRIFKFDHQINDRDKAPQQNVHPGTCVDGYKSDEIIMVPHRALQVCFIAL